MDSSSEILEKLKNCSIFYTHDCSESKEYKISYLSYVEVPNEDDITISSPIFGQSNEPVKTSSFGLKLLTSDGKLDQLEIDADDQEGDAYDSILKLAVDVLIEQAFKNSQRELNNWETTDKQNGNIFNLELNSTQVNGHGRRLIGKILAIANLIASLGRRGPATYVILSKQLYEILEEISLLKFKTLYSPGEAMAWMAGLKILCSDKLKHNQFIVGRKPNENEPGLHLITSDNHINNYVLKNNDKMVLDMYYKLIFVGNDETIHNNSNVFAGEVKWVE